MKTSFNFLEKRPLFESTISTINKSSLGVEMLIYDLITRTREEYSADLRGDIKNITNHVRRTFAGEIINLSNRYALEELLQLNKNDSLNYDDVETALSLGKKKALSVIDTLEESYETESLFLEAIIKHGHAPAYIFVYGYDASSDAHLSHSFGGLWTPNEKYEFSKAIHNNISDLETRNLIKNSSKEDNAVLVSKEGNVEGMLVQLVDVNPERIKEKYKDPLYPANFGLDAGGHSRHHSAIGYSFHVPETTVITLGESGYIRMFKQGHLVFSTVNMEQAKINNRWQYILGELDI